LRQFHFAAWAVVVIALLLFSADRCAADTVIETNLGAGSAFNHSSGWSLAGSSLASDEQLGVSFFTGGSAYTFTSAELPLDRFGGTDLVNVSIQSDVAGLPGAILQTIPFSGLHTSPTLMTVNTNASLILAANTTYWLTAVAGAGDTRVVWMRNSTADDGLVVGFTGVSWTYISGQTPAFRINGTAVAVPLPASAWAGAALLPMALLARRRACRS
jgi:hypothetical protein